MKKLVYLMFILSLLNFLLLSCHQNSDVEKRNGSIYINNIHETMLSFKELTWRVGDHGKHLISKGVHISISIPQISSGKKKMLLKETGADAWAVRLKREATNEYYGNVFVPFIGKASEGSKRTSSYKTKKIVLRLYYAAASISHAARMQRCPKLNHDRKITDISIAYSKNYTPGSFQVQSKGALGGELRKVHFRQLIFNGRSSLLGEYKAQIALLNSDTKQLLGPFIDLDGTLKVAMEKSKSFRCTQVKDEMDKTKGFRLKRN